MIEETNNADPQTHPKKKGPPTPVEWIDADKLTVHPSAAQFPMLSEEHEDYASLEESIKLHGIKDALYIDEANRILDGRHRQDIAKRNGIWFFPPALDDVCCSIVPYCGTSFLFITPSGVGDHSSRVASVQDAALFN